MKLITALVALTAFVAAHDGPHDDQGNALDNQGNLIKYANGTVPAYPIPSSQQNNSSGSQNQNQNQSQSQSQNKQYPLPSNQSGNNSSGNQSGNQGGNQNGGNQGGNQEQKSYPIPIPNNQSGGNQATMDEFQKFLKSPFMLKFMEYFKLQQLQKKQN